MKKYKLLVIAAFAILTNPLYADIQKGHEILLKEVYGVCDVEPMDFSRKYTQDEWKDLYHEGELPQVISDVCPHTEIKDFWIDHVYDFAKEFAQDTENIPKC